MVLCGWAYLSISSGPWFVDHVRPQLITSRMLEWAYPWLIPPNRQASNPKFQLRPFELPAVSLEGGLKTEQLHGSVVDVWTKKEGDASASPLVLGAATEKQRSPVFQDINSGVLLVNADQVEKLAEAKAYLREFILRPHTASPLDSLWMIPPVKSSEFDDVGHPVFALLAAWIGGMCAVRFRDPRPRRRDRRWRLNRDERRMNRAVQPQTAVIPTTSTRSTSRATSEPS